jgi:hypothetical protein
VKIYQKLAQSQAAMERCEATGNNEWAERWRSEIDAIVSDGAPSGAGFDNGTTFDGYTGGRLVFSTSFHHMNDNGYYDGWTDHQVIVSPDFELDYTIRVSGRNRNAIKAYIAETFSYWLDSEA